MYNALEEKAAAVSRTGSFWTRNIAGDARRDIHAIAHVPHQTDAPSAVLDTAAAAAGASLRVRHNLVIRFQDKDIAERDGKYVLGISDCILVTTIRQDGRVLARNRDFASRYGEIVLPRDPRAMFPEQRIMCRSAVEKRPNVLCYPLGIQPVYGSVDEVVGYYRNSQSVRQFHKAAAQAGGMAVVKADSFVEYADDTMCVASDGTRYDLPYPHAELEVGDPLRQGDIIGGELFRIIGPDDELPDSVESLKPGYALPVPGLEIPNSEVVLARDGKFMPDYAPQGPADKYKAWLEETGSEPFSDYVGTPPAEETGNAATHFRTRLAPHRTITYILDDSLPEPTRERILEFMHTQAPVGSVLLEG